MQRLFKIALTHLYLTIALASTAAGAADCRVDESKLTNAALSAERFLQLRTLHVAVNGEIRVAEGFHGASPQAATNIKSASKTLLAAVAGAAIEQGVIESVDERVADILPQAIPAEADPALNTLTIGHLLSMQAGLERTSGRYYGAWVASNNWVNAALARPMKGKPGGRFRYSTGNSHVLSAILERRTGKPSYALANQWLASVGVKVDSWMTDPQGIAFGGNQVSMRPRALLALGELYRRNGVSVDGEQILPPGWVETSWAGRGRSPWTNDAYGYGWFIRDFAGYTGYYGWGYGGQMLYVIPALSMTAVMTSDPNRPSGRTGYRDALHGLMETLAKVAAQECSRRELANDAR